MRFAASRTHRKEERKQTYLSMVVAIAMYKPGDMT